MAIRDTYPFFDDETGAPPPRTAERDAAQPERATGILAVLWRHKLMILASIILCLLAGIGYIAVTPPRYVASTSMLIDPRLGKTVGSDPLQPGFVADTSAIDSQIKLFTSQTVLERVAAKLDLAKDPEFNGAQRSLLQRLLHPGGTPADAGVDLKALEDAITIKRPDRTYIVTIDVLARDPKMAADIANGVTQAYFDDQISARVGTARDDTQFVRDRLDALSTQIKDAENKVEAFKTANNIVDSSGLRSNEQQVSDLTRSLGEARAKASDAKARYEEVRAMARSGRLDASSEALRSQTIERLRQAQAETDQTVAKLAQTLGVQHPEMIEAQGRKAKLDRLIKEELKRIELAAGSDYKAAHTNETQIAAALDRVKAQSTTMSRNLVPLEQLERNARVLRGSFDRLAAVNGNLTQQQGDTPPGRVIAVARPPVSPAQPRKAFVGIIALSAGVFLGLASALLLDGLEQSGFALPPVRLRRPIVPDIVFRAKRDHQTRSTEPLPPRPTPPPRGPVRRYWDDQDDDVRS